LLSSYHGAWCFAGLQERLLAFTINLHIETFHHFILTFIIVTLIWMYSRNNLTNIIHKVEPETRSVFKSVNPTLVGLGIIGFKHGY
jgi:hypothetical protein